MARINPKLNLNKTPQNVEDSSLVFAKNIKLNKELSICPDSAVKGIKHWVGEDDENPGLVGKIVGVNNKIYFFTHKEGIPPEPPVPELPYIELEYIESSGTQYIDTGIKSSTNLEIRGKFNSLGNYDSTGTKHVLFGGRDFQTTNQIEFMYTLSNNLRAKFGTNELNINSSNWGDTIEIVNNKNYLTINGTKTNRSNITDSFESQHNIVLCSIEMQDNEILAPYCSQKIYYFKIYNNETLILDLIPVKRRSDNVICMYDLVSETFFTNAGTGDFIAGPEVQQEVTSNNEWSPDWRNSGGYIEFNGNQYINLGVNFPNGFKSEIKLITTDIQLSWIVGAYDASTTLNNNTGFMSGKIIVRGYRSQQEYPVNENTLYYIETSITNQRLFCKLNGNTVIDSSGARNELAVSNFCLGALGKESGQTISPSFIGKIYYIQLFDENNTLVREMYPAIVNNIPCMYDYVTDTYFYNQGTGNFTVSQEVIDASIPPEPEPGYEDSIFEYDELTEEVNRVNCNWNYNGGEITGCVTVNNTGEHILTISEYNTNVDVPIKHINLSKCSSDDDESIYTQHPNIPITNLLLSDYYTCNIPNGVYQFFIRYKIRDNFYTNWFPASKELFAGNINELATVQGKLKYTNINKDSDESFVLMVDNLCPEFNDIYESFQIGFIISNDNGTFARAWKHFNFDTTEIYFDYNNVEEENIDEILKSNYEIFNPKNVIAYKNKLYISNYKETSFDNDIQEAHEVTLNSAISEDYVDSSTNLQIDGKKLVKSNVSNDYYDYIYTIDDRYTVALNIYGVSLYCDGSFSDLSSDPCPSQTGYPSKTNIGVDVSKTIQVEDEPDYNIGGIDILSVYAIVNNVPYMLILDKAQDIIVTSNNFTPTPISRYSNVSNISEKIDEFIAVFFKGIAGFANDTRVKGIKFDSNDNKYKFLFNGTTYNSSESDIFVDDIYIYYTKNRLAREQSGMKVYKTPLLFKYSCTIKQDLITSDSLLEYPHKYNTNTLLFKTKYDFFIHYVKQNGVTTNGIEIGSLILNSTDSRPGFDVDKIVYPTFSNIIKPEQGDYVAAFISMNKANTVVSELFNVNKTTESNVYYYKADSIELDTMLYTLNKNIKVYTEKGILVSNSAEYHPSGDTENVNNFGTAGFISFSTDINFDVEPRFYIVIELNFKTDKYTNLIKVTPFFLLNDDNPVSYTDYLNLNLRGYICDVSKLKRIDVSPLLGADDIFVSGNDVFTKNLNLTTNVIELEEYKEFLYTKVSQDNIKIKSSFNLNFLSLKDIPTPIIREFEDDSSNDTTAKQQVVYLVNSMTSSSIYILYEMYKSYTTKVYSKILNNRFTEFNNTVRSSNIDVDEVYRDIYRFEAEDYYNVPTNRGIIVNLFSIINKIYVHCEHALFVFTDTNMMKVGENLYTSNNTEVALQQSTPFEIGIQEIFDSEYGYAGLQNKKHSLITFNSYIFYDKLAKTIYAYSGDSLPTAISNGIDKILKWFEPDDIMFAADNANDRFFINLRKEINDEIKNICLSFNFTSKSFVSIHDIDFDESFNSRINTYFQKNNQGENNNEVNIYKIDNDNINNYSFLKKISILQLADVDDIFANSINKVANSIDVICNLQYEVVKTLNWINWICREVNNYNVNPTITVAEEDGKLYSGHYIRIYSDETYSPLIPLTNDENKPLRSNDVPLMAGERKYNPQAYTYPRYNCGVWSINNFRDIRNINANKNPSKPDRLPISDNKSLLYGKYFVVRFIFKDKNFKLENIKFNMGNYEKS